MAETVPKTVESKGSNPASSPGAVVSWWNKFHFSGRVIMCSVLFGFGLILIGSLVFAINMDADSPKSDDEEEVIEIPRKAPSDIVGPVLMGIGSFIAISGIVMCLFETQVCRKKTGDSSPLISEGGNDPESTAVASTSHIHKHGIRKPGTSPNRLKGRHVKYHSKDRNQQKTPSPRSLPVTIEPQRSFMTSSEDRFLTPPNTLSEQHPALVHSNSREAEIQTSSSLMKSFTSSGPSWNESSTEFQTPSTSFRDSSVSLENSIEVGKNQDHGNMNTSELHKLNINAEFLTPVPLEREKVQNMASQIQNLKQRISNAEAMSNVDMNFNDNKKDELPRKSISEIFVKDGENVNKKSLNLQAKNTEKINQRSDNTENINALMEHKNQPSNIQQNNRIVVEIHQNASSSELKNSNDNVQQHMNVSAEEIINICDDNSVINEIPLVDNNPHIVTEDNLRLKTDFSEIIPQEVSELNSDINHLSHNADESASKTESDKSDEQNDLESSVSSVETVVFQDSVPEIPSSTIASDKSNSVPQKTKETEIINIIKSEKTASSLQNDGVDTQKSQNDKISEAYNCENKDINLVESVKKETSDLS